MAYIHDGDIYCDECGRSLKGATYVNNVGEADSPIHCGAGESCLDAVVLSGGRRIGALVSDRLTDYGIAYVKQAIRDGGEVAEYWRAEYWWQLVFSDYDVEDRTDEDYFEESA